MLYKVCSWRGDLIDKCPIHSVNQEAPIQASRFSGFIRLEMLESISYLQDTWFHFQLVWNCFWIKPETQFKSFKNSSLKLLVRSCLEVLWLHREEKLTQAQVPIKIRFLWTTGSPGKPMLVPHLCLSEVWCSQTQPLTSLVWINGKKKRSFLAFQWVPYWFLSVEGPLIEHRCTETQIHWISFSPCSCSK